MVITTLHLRTVFRLGCAVVPASQFLKFLLCPICWFQVRACSLVFRFACDKTPLAVSRYLKNYFEWWLAIGNTHNDFNRYAAAVRNSTTNQNSLLLKRGGKCCRETHLAFNANSTFAPPSLFACATLCA